MNMEIWRYRDVSRLWPCLISTGGKHSLQNLFACELDFANDVPIERVILVPGIVKFWNLYFACSLHQGLQQEQDTLDGTSENWILWSFCYVDVYLRDMALSGIQKWANAIWMRTCGVIGVQ